MRPVAVLILLLFVVGVLKAQKRRHSLQDKLLPADSVVVVSHDDTNMSSVEKGTGKHIPPPRLVLNGRPNQKIIHERKTLADTAVQRLARRFTTNVRTGVIETGKCFMPPHAVFLYHKGQLSFINICFGCERPVVSKGNALGETDFYFQKWDELYTFFIQNGLTYALISEEPQHNYKLFSKKQKSRLT